MNRQSGRKDVANLAKASGDDILRRETQAHINKLDAVYGRISEGAGLIKQRERMSVAEFRRVNTIQKLKHPEKYGIVSLKQCEDEIRVLIRSDAINKSINTGYQNKRLLYSNHYIEGRSYVYGKTHVETPTNRATIHCGKKGAHVVPTGKDLGK